MINSDKKDIIDFYKNNKKIKIPKYYYGNNALEIAKNLFHFASEKDYAKWIKNWSPKEQKEAVGFLTERDLIKNKRLIFHLLIGSGKKLAVLGHKIDIKKLDSKL